MHKKFPEPEFTVRGATVLKTEKEKGEIEYKFSFIVSKEIDIEEVKLIFNSLLWSKHFEALQNDPMKEKLKP